MTYVLLDDNFGDHPKIEELSDAAFRAHVRAMCWAKRHKTGGVIKRGALQTVSRGKPRVSKELERARLWVPTGEGWTIHGWDKWFNETPEEAEQVRQELDEKRKDLSEKRAAAGRAGGRRSAEVRTEVHGTAQPSKQPEDAPKQLASGDAEANSKQTSRSKPSNPEAPSGARASASASASAGSYSAMPLPKELSGSAHDAQQQQPSKQKVESVPKQKRAANRAEALQLPAQVRSAQVLENPHEGDYLEPNRWPEVEAIACALAEASGLGKPRLSAYGRDAGVRAVVALLADGYEPGELVRVAQRLPRSEFWRKGKHGLASLTPEVVRRALAEPASSEDAPGSNADEFERKRREAYGDAESHHAAD